MYIKAGTWHVHWARVTKDSGSFYSSFLLSHSPSLNIPSPLHGVASIKLA